MTKPNLAIFPKAQNKPKQTPAEIMTLSEALSVLERLRSQKISFDAIARRLNHHSEFSSVDRGAVYRWTQWVETDAQQSKTSLRIIRAANLLRADADVVTVKCAYIREATEILPWHLIQLPSHKDWLDEWEIKLSPSPVETVAEGFLLLNDGVVDVAFGPQNYHHIADFPKIARLTEIAVLKTQGLFPLKSKTVRQFASDVDALIMGSMKPSGNFTVGCLANADYRLALERLLMAYKYNSHFRVQPVYNSATAFEMLKQGIIHAVIGHSVFIANVAKLVNEYPRQSEDSNILALSKLQITPSDIFGSIVMDMYVNPEVSKGVGIMGLIGAFTKCEKYINDNLNADEVRKPFIEEIIKVLGFNERGAKAAANVLAECNFDIKSFEKETLLELCYGPLRREISFRQ